MTGDIKLKVPKSLNSTLQLEGKSVEEGEVTLENKRETESPETVEVSGNCINL